jgi:hypothetical protein
VSNMRRGDRKGGARKQRRGPRVQNRLGGPSTQSDETPHLTVVGGPRAGVESRELYVDELDDVFEAYLCATMIKQSKPPDGCVWNVTRDEHKITVSAVKDNKIMYRLDGTYSDPKTGRWVDPRIVAERLAQLVLWACVLDKVSAFKGKTPVSQE